jgi:hypothetical protein
MCTSIIPNRRVEHNEAYLCRAWTGTAVLPADRGANGVKLGMKPNLQKQGKRIRVYLARLRTSR